jgi:four helix bundle protein
MSAREFNSDVFKLSLKLTKDIRALVWKMPNTDQFTIGQQILRAALSIPSNISEGFGRNSDAQILNFLNIANGSCCEVISQLMVIDDERINPNHDINESNYELKDMIESTLNIKQQLRKLIHFYTNKKN